MKEFIDRETALEIVKRTSGDYATAFCEIAHAEVADVVEVVHGKWETEIDDELGILKHTCQACGFVKRTDIHVALNWNYCPNCGAKMEDKS